MVDSNKISRITSYLKYWVLSSFLCKFFIFQFFEERQILTHFSYRVCLPV